MVWKMVSTLFFYIKVTILGNY